MSSHRPTNNSLAADLELIAVDLAVRAGELMLRRRAEGFEIRTKSSPTDVVTDVDRAVEAFLVTELARLRPADGVFGEEQGVSAQSNSGVRWIVDPIDGTVNFMLGLPQFAVSVAAELDDAVVAGCVHNPVSGDCFHAAAGGGAYLGRARLFGPRSVPLAEAVVATGFGYDRGQRAAQGRVIGELLGRVGNIRRLGSAALDLCALSAGWVDLYYEGALSEWDFAAGALIAAESGVRLSGSQGRRPGVEMVAGAHPEHAEEFFALLDQLGAAEAARVA
ncbi:inositol monophosphatase family protein [Jatrophihabitans sp. DSM 45814]